MAMNGESAASNGEQSTSASPHHSQPKKASQSDEQAEVEAAEEVCNSMLYYRDHAKAKMRAQTAAVMRMSPEDRQLLQPNFAEHLQRMTKCVEENQRLFDMLVNCAAHMFDESNPIRKAHTIIQLRPSSEHYMSKTRSTLKQIVRDWSVEGGEERRSCYDFTLRAIEEHFPQGTEERHRIRVLVPGAGLARFAWELLQRGFSVTGNEFSIYMLLASNFVLNTCDRIGEFTIYPYVLDFANSFSFDDQLRPVCFPDVDPSTLPVGRLNTFSMCAGDFLQAYGGTKDEFDCVASIFFLDTAANPVDYIRTIHRILKPGGVWVNFGPLTYHFDADDREDSLQLPFDELLRIIRLVGFRVDEVRRAASEHKTGGGGEDAAEIGPSLYTCNPASMLRYEYRCTFFKCTKPP